MPKKMLEATEEHFSKVTDPLRKRTKEHKQIDIMAVAICVFIFESKG